MATQLRPFLSEIANAIRSKKGTSGVINAQNFASEIASIPSGGGENPLQALVSGKGDYGGYYLCAEYKGDNVDFLNGIDFSTTTNMQYMFYNCPNLTTISLIDTSSVTKMDYMFRDCSKLTSIPHFDTSSVTSMGSMFYNCSKLTSIPQLNMSSVTNVESMFRNCSKLTYVPQLNTSSVTGMRNMFYSCSSLETIDVTALIGNLSYFTYYCFLLTKLIIRTMETIPTFGTAMFQSCYHFLGEVQSLYNPDGLKDGRIYVPDAQVDNLKAATGWADFADIIVPLSTLVE